VLARSGVGATVEVDAIPRSEIVAMHPRALQHTCVLAGGDDYELLFTAPPAQDEAVRAAGARAGVAVTPIGRIEAEAGLRIVDASGAPVAFAERGFDHFA